MTAQVDAKPARNNYFLTYTNITTHTERELPNMKANENENVTQTSGMQQTQS